MGLAADVAPAAAAVPCSRSLSYSHDAVDRIFDLLAAEVIADADVADSVRNRTSSRILAVAPQMPSFSAMLSNRGAGASKGLS